MPDVGAVIEGTKSSTADDFLSFGEFRYFNIFICAYAAMYDAFARLDGGDAGRGPDDDLRLTEQEFVSGYRSVVEVYGFVGLSKQRCVWREGVRGHGRHLDA